MIHKTDAGPTISIQKISNINTLLKGSMVIAETKKQQRNKTWQDTDQTMCSFLKFVCETVGTTYMRPST